MAWRHLPPGLNASMENNCVVGVALRVGSGFKFLRVLLLCISLSQPGLSALKALAAPAANDLFADRIKLVGTNVNVTASNRNASKEPGEPDHASNSGGSSLWWAWTAPADGDVVIRTDESDFDTLLAVYTGPAVSALDLVASNDDHSVLVTSRVRFQALSGTQYAIAVDGFNDSVSVDTGIIQLTLMFSRNQ